MNGMSLGFQELTADGECVENENIVCSDLPQPGGEREGVREGVRSEAHCKAGQVRVWEGKGGPG